MVVRAESRQVSPRALLPGTEVNGWRVVKATGESRHGFTYQVVPVSLGEMAVLKMGREPGDAQVERELAQLMKRAPNRHVGSLLTRGRWPHETRGEPFFVMEWVAGYQLQFWAEAANPAIHRVVDKLATVALTLEHLHAEGILHRDVKPEHILIHQQDFRPVLIDFGVWRHTSPEGLPPGLKALGTPHLLSPEAVAYWREQGGKPDTRYEYKPTDDVYALGVTAYRVLTGRWPYSPQLPREDLFAAIERQAMPSPRRANRRLPRALCEVLERMMARRVKDRFQSCGAAHAALIAAVSLAGPEAMAARVYDPRVNPGFPPAPRPRPRNILDTVSWALVAVLMVLSVAVIVPRLRYLLRPAEASRPEGPRAALAAAGTPCAASAVSDMHNLGIGTLRLRPQEYATLKGSRVIDVRDSEQAVWAMQDPWASRVPVGTLFHGRIWVRDRLYGRFDRMVMPDGRQVPICMELRKSEYVNGLDGQDSTLRLVPGIALAEPSARPGAGRVDIQDIEADVVKRWGPLKQGAAQAP